MCFDCSKELTHQNGSFEQPQHMFCLRYKKYEVQIHFNHEACDTSYTKALGPVDPQKLLPTFKLGSFSHTHTLTKTIHRLKNKT